ncbi:MAG: A/G-specific adenine glycosylase [Burkholderiaceae bacterium]
MPRRQSASSTSVSSSPPSDTPFAAQIIAWQRQFGRHQLPWQNQTDPYCVWLSEIMLQQTQVSTVIPYYYAFLDAFPDVTSLASAASDQVMSLWSGLGYYSRARNLHRCAQQVRDQHYGQFPADLDALIDLPGIGRSTAAAIAVFAFGQREAILDGNVKRVFCRHFGIDGELQRTATINKLWSCAERELARTDPVAYTQGLMDLGATCCTRSNPSCERCPLAQTCVALASDRVSELPRRRQRAPLPTRATVMLVVLRASGPLSASKSEPEVLVCLRPDTGIWPGLLSLPESSLEPLSGVEQHLGSAGVHPGGAGVTDAATAAEYKLTTKAIQIPPIVHSFTHYRLNISPLIVRLSPGLQVNAPDSQWLKLSRVASAPLPAPVKKLLLQVATDNNENNGSG